MRERKRNILKQAIRHLSKYSIEKEEVWRGIQDALKQVKDNMINPLVHLPAFNAPEKVWMGIEESLNQKRTPLERSINELPVYKAPEGIWEKINPGLKKKYVRFYDLRKIAAAAAILLAMGSALLMLSRRTETRLTRSDRNSMKEIHHSGSDHGGLDILYNPALCKGNPEVCNSPVFIDLLTQLKDINTELTKMEPLLKQHNPQLQNYYYRLENNKAEIEKQIIRLLIES